MWHLAAPLLIQFIRRGRGINRLLSEVIDRTLLTSLNDADRVTQYFDCWLIIGHDFHLLSFSEFTTLLAKVVRKNSWTLTVFRN